MSGLAAVFRLDGAPAPVEPMLEAAPHRGTELRVHRSPGMGIGIQRRPGEDPFVSSGMVEDRDLVVALSGCLYRGDSIVAGDEAAWAIADTFRLRGPGGLEGLVGSFAAVIAEPAAGRAVAFRSPVGERPLFWCGAGQGYAFASEVKEVLPACPAAPAPDVDAVLDLITGHPEGPERTAYRGIHRVLPGSWMEVRGDNASVRRFWKVEEAVGTARISVEEAVCEFRRLLRLAVSRRLREGTALLLSGGLDSTAVATEAAPLHAGRYGRPLMAVSATYPDHPTVDESDLVKATAERLGCEVLWVHPRPRPFADLARGMWLHDGPDIAPLSSNLHQILAAVGDAGITSVIDGHDGNIAFGGYGDVAAALLRRGKLAVLSRYIGVRRRRHGISLATALRRYLVPAVVDFAPGLRRAWQRLRPGEAAPAWVVGPLLSRVEAPVLPRDWFPAQAAVVGAALVRSLEHLERISLLEGVDVTHPLSDPDLLGFLLTLPPEIAFATGAVKSLVRLACPELPPAVTRRLDKTFFEAVAADGGPPHEILQRLREGPRQLPGVDWSVLERNLEARHVGLRERHLIVSVLSADHFLGCP